VCVITTHFLLCCVGPHTDALNGVICYRNQWTRPDEPCTELTIRTTQKIADGQSAPTFHGSYYQRMVTRRKVQVLRSPASRTLLHSSPTHARVCVRLVSF
jgi:hypothetical protein